MSSPDRPIKPDPPIRADGLCARPGCSKKLQPPLLKYAGAQAYDPYCSTECCRIDHKCPLPKEGPNPVGRPAVTPA